MERKYYTIDEKAARQAQSMWSFSDYVTGSKTAEYKQLVDKAYDLADQVAGEKPDRAEEAYSLVDGSDIIKSDDKDAVEKLQEKLDSLQKKQEQMKAVNAYYRKHKTLDGCPDLSPENIERLKQAMKADWHYQDKPYLSFELSNNNQNIHATKARLERLKAAKEKETTDYDTEHFKVVENTEMMRLQLFFDGKPDVEIREVVKRNGFKWSPKNKCWQRQLTNNAKYSLKCLIKQLDQLAG